MVRLALLTTLASSSLSLALPQRSYHNHTSGLPNSTAVTFYQGPSSDGACGLMPVATSQMTPYKCSELYTSSLSVARSPNADCSFYMWSGTSQCSVAASPSEVVSILRGNGSVCVTSGVEDGGHFQTASGMWSCS